MASGWTVRGSYEVQKVGADNITFKLMLLKSSYAFDKNLHRFVSDINTHELVATNYTGGYGGGGRKTAAPTLSLDYTNNRTRFLFPDTAWTSLGGATNDTLGGMAIIRETGGSDATAVVIAFIDISDFLTDGATWTWDADGTNGDLWANV